MESRRGCRARALPPAPPLFGVDDAAASGGTCCQAVFLGAEQAGAWVEPSAQPGTVHVHTGLGFPTCASTVTLFLLTCSAQRCCCTGPLPPSLCGHACSQLAHTAWYTGTCPSPALRSHKRCVGAAFRMSPHCPEACSLPTVPTACPNPTPLSCTGSRQAPPARLTSHWPAHSTSLHLSRLLCRAQLSITTEAG